MEDNSYQAMRRYPQPQQVVLDTAGKLRLQRMSEAPICQAISSIQWSLAVLMAYNKR